MDPLTGLGAGAAVVQLADLGFRLTHELCTFVKQASRAENEMLRLQSALSDLVLILYQVKQFSNDFMREGMDNEGVQELLLPLRGCIAEVSWLQNKIPRQIYQPVKQLVGLHRKLKWAFASSDITTSLSRLENQKTSLMAAITVVSSRISLKIVKEVQASSTIGTSTHDRLSTVESKIDALITETATARAAHGGLIFKSALQVVTTDALIQVNRDHIRNTLKEYSDNLIGHLPLNSQISARRRVEETLPSTLNDICRGVRVLAEFLPDDNIISIQENIQPSSHKVINRTTSGLDSTTTIFELSDELQGSKKEVAHYSAQRNSAFKKSMSTVQRRYWHKTFSIGEIYITTSRETLNDKSGVAIFICSVLFQPRSFLSKSGIRVVYKQRSDPRGSPSIGFTWNSHRILEFDHPVFGYVWEGNVTGVQRLLDDNQFSPYDSARDMMSPFCLAVAFHRVDICRSMVARVHNPKKLLRENASLLDMIISCFPGSKGTFQELSETIRFLQLYTDISEVHPHALCDELAYAGSVIPTKTGHLNPAVREVISFLK